MGNIAAFLLARYADEERECKRSTEPFMWGDRTGLKGLHPMILRHVHRWVPAKVLKDIHAKRLLVEKLSRYCWNPRSDSFEGPEYPCGICSRVGCVTLRMMAWPYTDHPDWQDEWRVDAIHTEA